MIENVVYFVFWVIVVGLAIAAVALFVRKLIA